MLETNVGHGVVVSSRKSECTGKACQEGKPCEEIIASSRKRYIFFLNVKILRLVTISGHFRLKSNNLEHLKLNPYFPIF
jgi:hypothetical protein